MKREREKVITILRFYRDVDKTIKLNERVIEPRRSVLHDAGGRQHGRYATRERHAVKPG